MPGAACLAPGIQGDPGWCRGGGVPSCCKPCTKIPLEIGICLCWRRGERGEGLPIRPGLEDAIRCPGRRWGAATARQNEALVCPCPCGQAPWVGAGGICFPRLPAIRNYWAAMKWEEIFHYRHMRFNFTWWKLQDQLSSLTPSPHVPHPCCSGAMLSIPSTVLLTPHPFRGGQGTLLAAGFPPQPGVQPHFPVPEHPWVVVRKQSGHRPNADPSPKAKTSKKKRYARSNKNVVWGVEDGRETPLLGARSGEVKRSCNHPARRNPYRLFFL